LTYSLLRIATFRLAHLCRSRPRGSIREQVVELEKSFETPSLPTLTRSYLRRFTFYVADPLSSIRRGGPVAGRSFVSPLICGLFKTPSQI